MLIARFCFCARRAFKLVTILLRYRLIYRVSTSQMAAIPMDTSDATSLKRKGEFFEACSACALFCSAACPVLYFEHLLAHLVSRDGQPADGAAGQLRCCFMLDAV
jgi:hypothetical protein